MTALTELLARVKAAKGADRELDIALTDALLSPSSSTSPFTSSLVAAIALVERLLPGWCRQLVRHRISGSWRNDVCLWDPDEADEDVGACESEGATLALAIIAALLRALIAQERTATKREGT